MTDKSPTFADFNPTRDLRVDHIKTVTDDLIAYILGHAADASAEGKRRAALAATNYEQSAMWAVKSLFS